MQKFKRIFGIIFLLVLYAASNPANALAPAIAMGSDDVWAWATASTQKEANRAALTECNKKAQKMDCRLVFDKAVVRAESKNGALGWGKSAISLDEAKKEALKNCGGANCKIAFETTSPGFYSIAKSEPGQGGGVHFHITHSSTAANRVIAEAKQTCENDSGRKCATVLSGVIPGIYKTQSTPSHTPVASEKSCRPNTPTIRCSSQCTNGNCMVTYDNGCQMRVQVRASYNPSTNQWVYPPPSC